MQVTITRAARHAPDALSRKPRSCLKAQAPPSVLGSPLHHLAPPPRPQNSPGSPPSFAPTALEGQPKTGTR